MKKYKSIIFVALIIMIVLLIITITAYWIKESKTTTIPKDAQCIATIYQGKGTDAREGDYYYTYDFYQKGKSKYIVRKSSRKNVGVKTLYVEPTINYTKIVKESVMDEIEQEIQNDINNYNKVSYTYYDNGNAIICNTMRELYEKLF